MVKGSDNTTAVLTARTTSTNVVHQGFFRTEASGSFGLLQQLKSRSALKTARAHETLTQSYTPSKQWTLSSSRSAFKGVTTQVRDAARNESGTIYKTITFRSTTT